MIISNLTGGLGNQLFQYAAGKALAMRHGVSYKLDISAFNTTSLRHFDLQHFQMQPVFATADEINRLVPATLLQKAWQYAIPLSKRTYYRERYFHFDKSVMRLGAHVYLKGYFQSEKYFLPAKDSIRNEFTFREESIRHVKEFAATLLRGTSVSVHLRRGDYTSDPASAAYHGVLDTDYYHQAVSLLLAKFPDASFYVFSDDIQRARNYFPFPHATFVSGNISRNHLEDLYLMSRCRHHIIANSSFSWWGAWLNPNPEKLVIAPKKWFDKGPQDTYDLYPENWIVQ